MSQLNSTEGRVFASPLNLPAELFDMVLANLEFADLWRARSVCASWNAAIDQSPSLWTHLNYGVFNCKDMDEAILKCIKLANGRTKSLILDNPWPSFDPFFLLSQRFDLKRALQGCPRLESFRLTDRAAIPSNSIAHLPSPQLLTSLEIESRIDPEQFSRQLARMEGLRSLIVKEVYGQSRRWPAWLPEGSLPKLKHLQLVSDQRNCTASRIEGLQNSAMALAMPNLESLSLIGYNKRDLQCDTATWPNWPDFRTLTKLKKVVFRHRSWVGPIALPPSVEHLDVEVMLPATFRTEIHDFNFTLPNLKILHLNAEPEIQGPAAQMNYFWSELLKRSGCRLRELRMGDAHKQFWGPVSEMLPPPWNRDEFDNLYQGEWAQWLLFAMGSQSIGSLFSDLKVLQISDWNLDRDVLEIILEICPKLELLIWNGHYDVSPKEENELLDPISEAGRRLRFEICCNAWKSVYPEKEPGDEVLSSKMSFCGCPDYGSTRETLCFETPGVGKDGDGQLVYH